MRLDVFSQKKLHEALAAKGYDVSPRTVRRWVEGEATPSVLWQRAIAEAIGVPDTTKEAEPPDWATRLETKVDSIHKRQDTIMARRLTEALAPLDRIRRANELLDRLERLLPLLGEESPEETEEQDPAGEAQQGQSRE